MPELPVDQKLLLDGLLGRLALVTDRAELVRFVSEVLRTLLRRQGDGEFRAAIEQAFVDGLVVHTFEEAHTLAAEVIRVVITKRPEIALAWQAAQAAAGTPPAAAAVPAGSGRRESDRAEAAAPPGAQAAAPAAAPAAEAAYEFAAAEEALGAYLATLVQRRLDLLRVPPARVPSIAYRHGAPFFLFAPAFPAVLGGFVAGPLTRHCRIGLERRVYRSCPSPLPADAEAWAAHLGDRHETVWAVLLTGLGKLAAAHKTAEAKQIAAAREPGAVQTHKVVEVPVTRPRVYSILGVDFTLGQETVMRRVRVKVPPPYRLDESEHTALAVVDDLRRRARRAGIDLPDCADFQFLRTVLEFNPRLFVPARDEMMGLAAHPETNPRFLLERFKAIDETFSSILADLLAMMIFTRHGDGRFGFAEFYALCVGTGRERSASEVSRPFVALEVARRPRDMVEQWREILRRRLPAPTMLAALDKLLECWAVVGRRRFERETDAALALIDAFPDLFAEDPGRDTLAEIGRIVAGGLRTGATERGVLLQVVGGLYEPLVRPGNGRA